MRNERRNNKQKKRKKFSVKLFIIFIIYEFIIAAIVAPLLVFYGPFENVKRTVVGTAMATFTHQYIATTFLSNDEINKLIKSDQSGGASENESENLSKIEVSHTSDKDIERYDIPNKKFDGYILEIKDPTRIKIGYTKKLGEVGQRTSEIAEENGAVAAINGGGFTDRSSTNGKLWAGTGAYPEGIVISDGKLVYSDVKSNNTRINVTAFTKDGKLIVGDHTINDLRKENVVEAVSFRNTLVVNGKPTVVDDEGLNPRTAIGQKADGTIIMLVIDGRTGLKPGASLKEMQNILIQQGAYNASNLDGGSSSTMYLDGEVINNPCDWNGERTVATALYVKP
ncbi:phosphodiester glycosidase family protein [Clostridiaceae bacterium UIB06]|uniref:Phosphodiester glycosidase family protein n=1 Tax=Clostridium thailandense TaxID=2794346 RepID=A0A949X2A1_9CLOT|nr:phosphodiester glycosidase family protein [Clostridium thailandense]MBV7272989.1 phosphodiester glycosidase family protein [Clostridium thailandense]MCH5135653.1 phosphodiester glycosidase family protein [Clostridiaceae bacterium UIB06]